MRSIWWVAVLALGACFSKPPFSGKDAGSDGDGSVVVDPAAPTKIAAGFSHACWIDSSTKLACWGRNTSGELGPLRAFQDTGVPGYVSTDTGWTSVAVGNDHSCGVRDGAAYCWGGNVYRESKPTVIGGTIAVTKVDVPGTVERIFAGGHATCAVNTDHEAYCWGLISFTEATTLPLTRLGGTKQHFTQIAMSEEHGCAVEEGPNNAGRVWCWGLDSAGELGTADLVNHAFSDPVQIDSTRLFRSVTVGVITTCGITNMDELICWGTNSQGLFGQTPQLLNFDLQLGAGKKWGWVSLGLNHTCAIAEGDVYCVGFEASGGIGLGRYEAHTELDAVSLRGANQVSVGNGFTCSNQADGSARCWGSNRYGELGNGVIARKPTPVGVPLSGLGTIDEIVAGEGHMCARSGVKVLCWGDNSRRQIVSNAADISFVIPQLISTDAIALGAGDEHTCYVHTGGATLTCLGNNEFAQLGTTTPTPATTNDVPNPTGATWTAVTGGVGGTCAIATGRLFCWGQYPGAPNQARAELTAPARTWISVSMGTGFAVAVGKEMTTPNYFLYGFTDSDPSVAADRKCSAGKLMSDATTIDEVMSGLGASMAPPWVSAAPADGTHTCISRPTAGRSEVTCWGHDAFGAVGADTCAMQMPFTVVAPVGHPWPLTTAPDSVITSNTRSCALDENGELLCWGDNQNLASGLTTNASPIPQPAFPATTSEGFLWSHVVTGRFSTCGVKKGENTVYCFGENQFGEVGDGTRYEPSPVNAGVVP